MDTESNDTLKTTTELNNSITKIGIHHAFAINNEIYLYDFNELTADRILQAQRLFELDSKIISSMPQTPDEVNVIAQRQANRAAYAAILMKKVGNGFEKYDVSKISSFDALAYLKGSDFDKLLECKADFFTHSPNLSLSESIQPLNDIIPLLNKLTRDTLETVVGILIKFLGNSALMTSAQNTTMIGSIINALGIPSTGQ